MHIPKKILKKKDQDCFKYPKKFFVLFKDCHPVVREVPVAQGYSSERSTNRGRSSFLITNLGGLYSIGDCCVPELTNKNDLHMKENRSKNVCTKGQRFLGCKLDFQGTSQEGLIILEGSKIL